VAEEIELHLKRHLMSTQTLCQEGGLPSLPMNVDRAETVSGLFSGRFAVARLSQVNCLLCLAYVQRVLLEGVDAAAQQISRLHRDSLAALDALTERMKR
jgi:hypothetical protein